MVKLSLGDAPLRINARDDEYLKRLVKLIPAEVVALYLSFKEVATDWLGIWGLVCLVLVFLVRAFGTKGDKKSIQWVSVGVAIVSFVLWLYATGGYLIEVTLPAGVISAAIGVWTFMVPMFYKGD